MAQFVDLWNSAAVTSLGLFWMAFWAFGLGYLVSSIVQVFVTRARMRGSMGEDGPKSVALGTVFGFISSSCSFAALATTRALFAKRAGLVPSLAFLLASTNLVIELGIVISVFLAWQFVVAEYLGGLMLILLMWGVVRLTYPERLTAQARERAQVAEGSEEQEVSDWRKLAASLEGWGRVASRYVMEWKMVWKDVTIGFTVAGIIAAFVPRAFFEALFVGSGRGDPALWHLALQAVVGPVAAFFTFIGSMGNIPLAAVLYSNGVSFAGIVAFIFSDLVVFPVLRIQATYYGWRMAAYIATVFLAVLVATALIVHLGFDALGVLPDPAGAERVIDREFFTIDYTLALNVLFGALSLAFLAWKARRHGVDVAPPSAWGERILFGLALLSFAWLGLGVMAPVVLGAA
ncbi:hypothetical protein SAMN05444722_0638 [Rhodovulum sp. ES.010]|uniref:permease n=1 Tax=Rhodovulum sp. ES.010 TaxID=1882821 RepID=UPI000926C0B8|nr:permease [Rhodovulum sp. ES.010]SIO15588.1 hypothetical protein SAMN05444722_0638 [Rhodovulum sp. ES.010]